MVAEAESLEALRDRLHEAYAELPAEQLADLLAMALAVAELIGRYDLIRESGDAGPDRGA